jgi:glycine dehydrogenase
VAGRRTLGELEQERDTAFRGRHIGPTAADRSKMLAELGCSTLAELIDRAVPAGIRDADDLPLGPGCSEAEALARLRALAGRNRVVTPLIGTGYHGTITPPVIQRNILEDPGWYTAYTPYQPEISQGRLEALLNFQTMVTDLTAMEVANASLLDEATAAAEALAMTHRIGATGGTSRDVFLVDADAHPQTIGVVATRAAALGIEVVVGDPRGPIPDGCAGVLVQYPGSSGALHDERATVERIHAAGALAVFAADLLALTLVTPPGELGADIVCGSTQRFGVPLGFGGPHAAYLACRSTHLRTLPGRLVGVSVDVHGRPALRLAIQTREQHIRREKATSNICTAQVLLAVMAGAYAVWHGPDGLRAIATRVHRLTAILAGALRAAGVDVATASFFDTITVASPGQADAVRVAARDRGVELRDVDGDHVGISLDETSDRATVVAVLGAFGIDLDAAALDELDRATDDALPTTIIRTTPFLEHPTFHRYRSETEMMRYLRKLSDRDLALDRAMIPLGSCTMKLNAAAEMASITWPELSGIHPFAPVDQAEGWLEIIHDLESWLATITGYDAVSLQPNAGSQGELAGLLAIRGYHEARGEGHRDVCLIPSSAHGTNAASAAMAGMRVVVVRSTDRGDVDVDDLVAKADQHADDLAALMVTYPSTHGVYEERIGEVCEIVHAHGGQVYLDGANLNALVGLARPGVFGADVSHLNLHKTFCIPHGGGGPGVGPVAVRSHLAPHLPNHPLVPEAGPASGCGPISAAPWGSAGILPISWAYVTMMGGAGLTEATQVAILNANHVARRLAPHYPILFTGAHGLVAHECILDVRPLTQRTGVTVDDVAKRLVDYGFHAPTMSFPVAGTLMVETTESESLAELDRFCDAMIAIRAEIERVADGTWPGDDNPLHHAPHTAEAVAAEPWTHPYTRAEAAWPMAGLRLDKYWPPVGRIDGAHGDRNLVCACPPPEAYED